MPGRLNLNALSLAAASAMTLWAIDGASEVSRVYLWIALGAAAFSIALATALAIRQWLLHLFVLPVVAFVSFFFWIAILPHDPLIFEGLPVLVALAVSTSATLVVTAVVLAHVLARGHLTFRERVRPLFYAGAIACGLVAPALGMLSPTLERSLAAKDTALAQARFNALKAAVEMARNGEGQGSLCDGAAIKAHYRGLPFNQDKLARITRGAVFQDGYAYFVYCREKGGAGFTISADPSRFEIHGIRAARHFCSDESGKTGCEVRWTVSGNVCLPCRDHSDVQ